MGNVYAPARGRKVRTLRWHQNNACLCLNVDGVVTAYVVTPTHATLGAAFYLDRQDGQTKPYLVETDGARAHCSCPAFKRWRKCKHEAAIRKLISLGKLPASTIVD
jgi:hypothetical protein